MQADSVYNYFRDYDPSTGRYVQSDPIGILMDFSDPQRKMAALMGISVRENNDFGYLNHIYNYVDSNPIIKIDPTGEASFWSIYVIRDGFGSDNGNLWGEGDLQDNRCTLGPGLGQLGDACFPERCQKHDDCYAKNGCTASSWISSIFGGAKSCNRCNGDFFQ